MKKYKIFTVIFRGGKAIDVTAYNKSEAKILAQAEQIQRDKPYRVSEIVEVKNSNPHPYHCV